MSQPAIPRINQYGGTLRALPKGWRKATVGELCDQIDYGFTASADFSITSPRFLRITDIQNGIVLWDTVPGCRINERDINANKLEDGDIVFARTGGTTGKSFLIRNPPLAVFASYLIRLRLNKSMNPDFVYAFFQSEIYWRQIRASARGGAQPNVNATTLKRIELPLPPLTDQKRIVLILKEQMAAVERARAAAEIQLKTLSALSISLFQKAFAGDS